LLRGSGLRKLISFGFFCVGVVWVAWYFIGYVIALIPASSDEPYIELHPSPSGGAVAALVSYSGGGGLAPYCYDEIVIFNSVLDVRAAIKEKKYQVYSALCASFSGGGNSPKLEWVLDSKVRVEFALGDSEFDVRNVVMKGVDETGGVHVEFYAHQ